MKFRGSTRAAIGFVLVATVACGGGEVQRGEGIPMTQTTGTAQVASETTPLGATTTGSTGGTVSNLVPADKEFLSKAGMSGLYEVILANLALEQGMHAAVKEFAQRMITDHGQMNAELQQLATVKGTALPTELAGDHAAAAEHLRSLSTDEFDRAYMQHMVADHQTEIAEFERAAAQADDPEIRAFAAKYVPMLKEHLQLATTTAAEVQK